MITELEKQFFNTFGIEHEERYYNCKDNLEGKCGIKCPCECCDKSEEVYCYPQITDRQYLELICILDSNPTRILLESIFSGIKKVELLKNSILFACTANKDIIKHQVQAIFERER